ncbi:DegV family protein [Clostridium butyricum]|nr:DegV family protein [Clostridium butyricum]
MVGSILNITPILEVKNDGTLDTVGKIRGEKKSNKRVN